MRIRDIKALQRDLIEELGVHAEITVVDDAMTITIPDLSLSKGTADIILRRLLSESRSI